MHLIAVTVSEASRILAVLYETRIIKRPEDKFDMVVFLSVAARFASMCSLLTMIPAMITERSFASRFISDYEKLPRCWISSLINGIAIVLFISYYILCMLGVPSHGQKQQAWPEPRSTVFEYRVYPLLYCKPGLRPCMSPFFILVVVLISVLIMTLSSVTIIMVHRKDVAILHDLTNKTGLSTVTYTLSLKFQLEENVRVTRLVMFLSMGYSVWGFIGCGLNGTAFIIFDATDPLGHLFYALFNNYAAL
ncbi:unnamed protein product [Haemonchus placei]|uniref:G_PROTEIN_RECEP_F1_2 domain-containing protein n=1 Tax=Haemonchus placei TaxID=6290 RepID=A0A0N4WYT6_HAEPC|nr:unnamed protein product [Haemonchus placei]